MSVEVPIPGRETALTPKTRRGYAWRQDTAFGVLRAEVLRQDQKYGPFASDVATVRLAVACAEDEVRKTLQAWQERHKRPDWRSVRAASVQLAAVALRLARDIGVEDIDS